MRRLIRDIYEKEGYVFATKAADIAREAGFENPARLASNENPNNPPPGAVLRGKSALDFSNRYPDETYASLKNALKSRFGDLNIVTGVGMDGVIETVIRTVTGPGDKVCVSTPTFSFYNIAVSNQGGRFVSVKRRDDFSVDCDSFIKGCSGCKLAFLCSPNNPSGTITPASDIGYILENIDCMLFLDNAYVDFCDEDYRPLLKEYDNLIIGRTMSKAYGLAGMRVGYAFVPLWYEEYYLRAQTPFALNSVSAAAAEGALSDTDYVSGYISDVKKWRFRFENESGYKTYPSGANFVMIDVSPFKGDEAVVRLAKKGVIVRSCTSFPGLGENFIRVSVGEARENELFLKAIKEI